MIEGEKMGSKDMAGIFGIDEQGDWRLGLDALHGVLATAGVYVWWTDMLFSRCTRGTHGYVCIYTARTRRSCACAVSKDAVQTSVFYLLSYRAPLVVTFYTSRTCRTLSSNS
jgi:hypothetical protein